MSESQSAFDWTDVWDLRTIAPPSDGRALIVVGIEGCTPCTLVREQVLAFVAKEEHTTAAFYKFAGQDRVVGERSLLGEDVRHFPTVVGLADGVVAFRLRGARRDAKPTDVTPFEAGFGRHGANRTP